MENERTRSAAPQQDLNLAEIETVVLVEESTPAREGAHDDCLDW
jgi:hypothetical protein